MPLEFTYSDPLGIDEPAAVVSLSSNSVRYATLALAQSAEVGEAAVCGLEVDDPDALWNFVGLRALRVTETSAPSNNRIVYQGIIQDRAVYRADSMRTGASRRWSIDLSDYNWNAAKRVLIDSDSNRPAESAGTRLRWLLTDALHVQLYDYGHIEYPTEPMDACDYRGQRASDVIADCALPGGYNFWCDVNEAADRTELFFMAPDSVDYVSTLSISNDLADVNSSTVFAPSEDARLVRSPGRIAYGVYAAYANGSVYVKNTTTGLQFTKIDQTMSLGNVKSLAKATTIANRHLADHDEESDRISCSIIVPAAQVNDIRHGHLVLCKFTHFPGYESFSFLRVLRRTVSQEEPGGDAYYTIALEMVPLGDAAAPVEAFVCSTAIAAKASATDIGLENPDPTASVTVTAADAGYVVGVLMADNGNTPSATGMGTPAGYTNLDARDLSRATWFIGYKAASAGSVGMSASWSPGFASSGVWAAGAAWLPWAGLTVAQEATPAAGHGGDVVLGAAPTTGNTILMFAMAQDLDAVTLAPGGYILNPTTGWTELFSATTVVSGANSRAHIACWARCADVGDGVYYGFTYAGLVPEQAFCYVVEIAT